MSYRIDSPLVRPALDRVFAAIDDEGWNPQHHREVMARHRAEWPALWQQIDYLRLVFRPGVE